MKHKYFISFISQIGYGNIVIEHPHKIISAEDIATIQQYIQEQIQEKVETKHSDVRILYFKELFDE